jgi:hypothetical protein
MSAVEMTKSKITAQSSLPLIDFTKSPHPLIFWQIKKLLAEFWGSHFKENIGARRRTANFPLCPSAFCNMLYIWQLPFKNNRENLCGKAEKTKRKTCPPSSCRLASWPCGGETAHFTLVGAKRTPAADLAHGKEFARRKKMLGLRRFLAMPFFAFLR